MAPKDFKLSAVLSGHQSDVRAVLLPDPSYAVTASRDGSTRVWKQTSSTPPTYDATESSHGANFKTCLAYAPPSKEYPDGLIISSGQDALIEARQPTSTAEGNADGFMVGHSNQVCSLDVSPTGEWLVSGSWDKSARIWQIGRWETEVDLKGHTAAVWAVVAYDKDTIVTGCADRAIRVFDLRGKLMVSFDGKDIVRALLKLPDNHPSGGQIASASNDGVIRLWTLKGDLVAELHGHEAFIYSLAVLPSGEIVSSGEDRSVRIWQSTNCIQTITLPAISVWSVATSANGDIIAGSSDKIARIFTREQERLADAETLSQFDQSVQASSIPKQQAGEINMTDLPGPDFLTRKSGTREGQTQIIKETDGSATVYQWSMSQQTWIKIGQMVDSESSSGDKKVYNGKEYDYVFDVDIEDGAPAKKLPYNVTQNPYEAATKFLQDNELPISYLEETANFIIKNTQGASLGSSRPVAGDVWGTENRYRPGEVPTSTYQPPKAIPKQILPQKTYLSIVLGKPTQAMAQISKRNSEFGGSDLAMSSGEIEGLITIAQQLEKYNFQGPPSMALSADLKKVMPGLVKAATRWQPASYRLAALDYLRFLAAALKEFPNTDEDEADLVASILASSIFDADTLTANIKLVMIAIRLFSNMLFGSPSGRDLVQQHLHDILGSLEPVSQLAASDASLAVALSTFHLNASVYITTTKTDADADADAIIGAAIVEQLSKILKDVPAVDHKASATPGAQTTEPAYRAVVALGTILVGSKSNMLTSELAAFDDVPAILDQLKTKKYLDEPRFQSVVAEVRKALK